MCVACDYFDIFIANKCLQDSVNVVGKMCKVSNHAICSN